MQFSVNDMTCEHCARTITEAVREADPVAAVAVDVGTKCVTVVSDAPPGEIARAIVDAGYTPVIRPG